MLVPTTMGPRVSHAPSAALLALPLLVAACGPAPSAASPASAPSPSTPSASAPGPAVPDAAPTAGARFVLEPAAPRVARGDRITLKLVNAGTVAHSFTVPDASSSCGRFQWYVALADTAGQQYDQAWTDPMGPCGHVFIPAHELRFEPGQVATEVTIDTSRPWYLVAATPSGLGALSSTEPPKRLLEPGRYAVMVRGGDVTAQTELEIR